jgi:hypothetical protein
MWMSATSSRRDTFFRSTSIPAFIATSASCGQKPAGLQFGEPECRHIEREPQMPAPIVGHHRTAEKELHKRIAV